MIVGICLLCVIKEVVGVFDEVLNVWGEVYGVIVDVFISIEVEMYEEVVYKEGGWKDFCNFVIVKKVKESDVIMLFYLKFEDGGKVFLFILG